MSPLDLLAAAAIGGTVLGLLLAAAGCRHQRTHTHGTDGQ